MPTYDVSGADRSLLVVAFHYPPDNTSTGVLRTFKFTKYLLRHGWRSHVVSVPEHLYTSRNPPGADTIPSAIAVERTWACDLKSAIGIRGVYPGWLAVPDRYWPWFFTAARAGARTIRRLGIDAMYSTHPVPTAHLVALRLKRRFNLPWVADFRDPWVEDSMPRFRHWLEGKMECAVVESADRVICNTPAMRQVFLRAYPQVSTSKFVTITNGYDEADLAAVVPKREARFQLLHPGLIDAENRDPVPLLRGIRRALDNGWLDENDLLVTFLGTGAYGGSERFKEDIASLKLGRFVQVTVDRVPYRQALARMAGADVLVVLSENLSDVGAQVQAWTAMQVPAKLYEYLRLGRPLLALVSEGAVKELLETTRAGTATPPRDTEGVALALKRLYAERLPIRSSLPPANSSISSYSRESLSAALAEQLYALAPAPRAYKRAAATCV